MDFEQQREASTASSSFVLVKVMVREEFKGVCNSHENGPNYPEEFKLCFTCSVEQGISIIESPDNMLFSG